MAYKAVTIANALIEVGTKIVDDLTHMKTQKLLFFAHGWNLAFFNEPLIEESFEAWRFGPVVADLYRRLKKTNGAQISEYLGGQPDKIRKDDQDVVQLIDEVYRVYGRFSALELSDLTHQHGTPWQKAYIVGGEVIPNESIRGYFLSLGNQ